MIANPFTSTNRSGMFGEVSTGIMRFKRSYDFGTGTSATVGLGNTCGYFLWCPVGNAPSYSTSNSGTIDHPMGVLMYKADSASSGWRNTIGTKLGAVDFATWNAVRGANPTAITSVATPDDHFLGGVAAKSRLVSAGIVLRCYANPLEMTGEYIKLENVDIDTILEDSSTSDGASINALFDMSSHTPQPFMVGKSVRHIYINDRHNAGLEVDCQDGPNDPPDATTIGAGDSRQTLGIIPKQSFQEPTMISDYGRAHHPKMFGIAFRGVDPKMFSKLFIDAYCSKEFTIAAYQGIPQVPVGRTGPNVSEPAHLLATAYKSASDAVDNGVGALSAGLVSKGVSYLGQDVLGLAGFA